MDFLNVFSGVLAFLFLFVGLLFKWHKNHAIFIFSFLIFISNVVNPFLFMANENLYRATGWSAVGSFNFSLGSLVHAYSSSNFIYSLIVLFSLPMFILSRRNSGSTSAQFGHKHNFPDLAREKSYKKKLILFLVLLMIIYYPLYNNKIGITGVPGELPYHLSGIVHYIRAYLIPIVLVILLSKSGVRGGSILIVLLYAFVSGIAASSRFVGILPMVLLLMYAIRLKKYWIFTLSIIYSFFLWFAISGSRDLTFDGEEHNLLEVVYYSLTNISFDDIISTLDLLTGRLSGAQQIVLVDQFRGHDECSNLFNFLLGLGDVCTDTAGIIYGLDLTGTAYGVGLSLIPSIIVSSNSFFGHILSSALVSLLLWMSQYLFNKTYNKMGWHGIASLYLFLSVLFIFLGQMLFYYYLQYAILFVIFFARTLKKFLLHKSLRFDA